MAVPFPFRWARGEFQETRAYRTDILPGYSQAEQRRCLLRRARRQYRWIIATLDARTDARLEAALYGAAGVEQLVPAWPYVRLTTAPLAPGAGAIPCNTVSGLFLAGQSVMLWRSVHDYETHTILSVAPASITLDGSTVAGTWSAGAYVVPLHRGWLVPDLTRRRPTNHGTEVEVAFDLDPQGFPAVGTTLGSGPALLTLPMPDQHQGIGDDLARGVDLFDVPMVGFSRIAFRDEPLVTQSFPLRLFSAAAVTALWGVYDALLGALQPAWVPSYQADLVPVANVGPLDTDILIHAAGYTADQFPFPARRQLALLASPTTQVLRTIIDAVDNLDGTETITLDQAAGVTLDPRGGILSIARLMRLDEDALTVRWTNISHATAALRFRELPAEVPAP